MAKGPEEYKIKLSGPGHSFDRSISEQVATQIINLVMTGNASVPPPSTGTPPAPLAGSQGSPSQPGVGGMNAKQFLSAKRPTNFYQRVACLAYFLTHGENVTRFKTRDITRVNTDAAQSKLSNPSLFVAHATATYHFLSSAGGGAKQITTLGEAVVEALPDQAKVKTLQSEHKPRKSSGRKKKNKT
jgi:hypothetical protein